jgi:hypothetical protein
MELTVFFLLLHQPLVAVAVGTPVLSMHLKLVVPVVVVIIFLLQAAQLVLLIKVMQVVTEQQAVAEMPEAVAAVLTL